MKTQRETGDVSPSPYRKYGWGYPPEQVANNMDNSNTKAIRAEVPLGNILIEGYLLPENLWTPTNKFGVSKTQAVLLAYPEYERSQAAKRYIRAASSEEAKTLAPQGLLVHPKVSIEGANEKADLLSVGKLPLFLKICSRLGSGTATELLIDLAGLSLQQAFCDAFGIQFDQEDRQDWLKKRQEGKQVRLDMTDAVQWYIEKHKDELSENAKQWMYKHCSDALNIGLFGRTAKKLCLDLQVKDRSKLRDALTTDELRWISQVEELGARLVVYQGLKPLDAVKESLARNIIPIVDRKAE